MTYQEAPGGYKRYAVETTPGEIAFSGGYTECQAYALENGLEDFRIIGLI